MNKVIFIVSLYLTITAAVVNESSPLDQAQKEDILAMANAFRCRTFDQYKHLFEGVEHPPKLHWSPNLELLAQQSTNSCSAEANSEGFVFTLKSSFNQFVSPTDLPVQSYFGLQLEKGLDYLSLEDATNYQKTNVYEELSAHVLSDKVSSFACAATTCGEDRSFQTYFTCFFNTALQTGEGLVTGLHNVQEQSEQTEQSEDEEDKPKAQPKYEGDGLLNSEDMDSVLDWHNKYRRQFNQGIFAQDQDTLWPRAQGIPYLKMKEELVAQAQAAANRCVFEHTDKGTLNEFNLGENIYASTWKANMKDVLHRWMLEGKDGEAIPVSYAENFQRSRVEGAQIGHFSQVIWEKTLEVGCARRYCPEFKKGDETTSEFIVVCQYYPAGNVIGEPIYTVANEEDDNSGSGYNSGSGRENSGRGKNSGNGKGNSGSNSGNGRGNN